MWRALEDADLPALVALARSVLAADGGLPLAADEDFLWRRFLSRDSWCAVEDGRLVAAVGRRRLDPDHLAALGMVAPDRRGAGLGGQLVDWALRTDLPVRLESESLTEGAHRLFLSRGLRQTFAEDVMRRDLAAPVDVPVPAGVTLTPWTPELAGRFFAVYEASFRERPGFPGWSQEQWVAWISDGDEFAPQWTLLASRGASEDVGFVAAAAGGWIVQVGVVPSARGSGLGAALTAAALHGMRAGGEREAFLDVNVNNAGAGRIYERLGFVRIGRRARYGRP
jgi:mycothiol synthase